MPGRGTPASARQDRATAKPSPQRSETQVPLRQISRPCTTEAKRKEEGRRHPGVRCAARTLVPAGGGAPLPPEQTINCAATAAPVQAEGSSPAWAEMGVPEPAASSEERKDARLGE